MKIEKCLQILFKTYLPYLYLCKALPVFIHVLLTEGCLS